MTSKIKVSTLRTDDFENWINEELDKHQINYKVNDNIIFDVIYEFTWEFDTLKNRKKLLQKLLSNPDIKTLKDIRKEKLESINGR